MIGTSFMKELTVTLKPFQANIFFFIPLKTSENLKYSAFRGHKKGNIGLKWVTFLR